MGSLAAGPTWQCYVFWLSRLTRCADRWINRLCLWFCLGESFRLEDEGMNLFHVCVSCIFSILSYLSLYLGGQLCLDVGDLFIKS